MNWIAARMQNTFGILTISNNKLNKELGNQMTDTLLGLASSVTSSSTSVGLQSSLAHMFYLGTQGVWDADSKMLEKIANEYMNQVIKYGVACCHHTCKNLEFNMKIIQASSLSPDLKQKFAEILAQATNTDPLYKNENSDVDDGNKNAHELVNGTNDRKQSNSESGKTSAGQDMSEKGNAKSVSQSQGSGASSGDSGAAAYELSQKSTSKSSSSAESSMPIFVVIAIIILIAIFFVGYVRNQKDEDYDDY